MSTVRDLINGALQTLGIIAANEVASPDDVTTCFNLYTQLIPSLSTNVLNIYTTSPQIFTLEPGKDKYTIGPGGDFDTARPVRIERIVFLFNSTNTKTNNVWSSSINAGTQSIPLTKWSASEYGAIRMRSFQNTYVKGFWDSSEYPLRTITFWPIPISRHGVEIWTWDELTAGALDDEIDFPPGYLRYLKLKLAYEASTVFGKELPQSFAASLKEAEDNLKNLNANSVKFGRR